MASVSLSSSLSSSLGSISSGKRQDRGQRGSAHADWTRLSLPRFTAYPPVRNEDSPPDLSASPGSREGLEIVPQNDPPPEPAHRANRSRRRGIRQEVAGKKEVDVLEPIQPGACEVPVAGQRRNRDLTHPGPVQVHEPEPEHPRLTRHENVPIGEVAKEHPRVLHPPPQLSEGNDDLLERKRQRRTGPPRVVSVEEPGANLRRPFEPARHVPAFVAHDLGGQRLG